MSVRIALACPYAWEDSGGVQVHVRALAERLSARGHAIRVLTPAATGPAEDWVVAAGRPVPLRYNGSSAPIDPRPWSRRAVGRALRAFAPDVLHAHEPLSPSTSMWALLEAEVPVVGTFHSGATRSRLFDISAPVLRRVADRLAIRVAVSERAAAFARARIGGSYELVPNGVDVGRFASAAPADLGPGTKLLFVGRLEARKGFRVALSAFASLAADRPGLRLVVAGEGPDRRAVDELPTQVRDRVVLLGAVPNDRVPAVARACDLFVGPSVGGESFGIVLVEAMAAGLPVVASDTPGYDEVVRDGRDGLLVPPRDAVALAAAVNRVLDDPGLAERLRAAGTARAAAYDWAAVVDRLEGVYAEATEGGRPPIR
jgi:phosphatidyl-myo-inositol alpha-mannosyltransferase